jgi:hypothetical protein
MGINVQAVTHAVAKPVGCLLLGGAIIWQVALYAGPPKGRALVHVSMARVEVTVDEARYRVEDLDRTPIVCELKPGRHMARMTRDGRVLYEEEFEIAPGEDNILVAWDGYTDGRSPGRGE